MNAAVSMHISLTIHLFLSNASLNCAFNTFNHPKCQRLSFLKSSLKHPEWNNDDFLESLSGTNEQRSRANEDYWEQAEKNRQSRGRMGGWTGRPSDNMIGEAALNRVVSSEADNTPEGMPQPGESAGGSRYRRMMETSTTMRDMSSAKANPYLQSQQPADPESQSNQLSYQDPYDIIEQQLNQPSANQAPPTQNYPPPTQPAKAVGRNRDADQIANTSDMYLAQLKLDSKIRKKAFLEGDDDTAQSVFGDGRVQNLPDELKKNPHVRAMTQQSKNNSLGTSDDESIPQFMYAQNEYSMPKKNPGLNYRQKLQAKKGFQSGLGNVKSKPNLSTTEISSTPPIPPPQPVVENYDTSFNQERETNFEPAAVQNEVQPDMNKTPESYQPQKTEPSTQQDYTFKDPFEVIEVQLNAPSRKEKNTQPENPKPQVLPQQKFEQPQQAQPQSLPQQTYDNISITYQDPHQVIEQQFNPGFQAKSVRPVGRNKDADQIANTSDMYMAQLKLDSKIRKKAFLDGDDNTAQQVFGDERVKGLPDELRKNPHVRAVTEQSKMNRLEVTTDDNESILFVQDYQKPKKMPGLNYREKLKQKKSSSTPSVQSTTEKQVQASPSPQIVVSEQEAAISTEINNEEYILESRSKIRTLMGLILKHKGGPGFGAGRLKGPEAKRLISQGKEIIDMLKSEVGQENTQEIHETTEKETEVVNEVEIAETQNPVDLSLFSVEETIKKYQQSSNEDERRALLGSLQMAMKSTLSLLDPKTDGVAVSPSFEQSIIASMKELPSIPSVPDQDTITQKEQLVQKVPSHPKPTSFQESVKFAMNKETSQSQAEAIDDSSLLLKSVLTSVAAASGDAKLGLSNTLSKEEAENLLDLLPQMRKILLDEFETSS